MCICFRILFALVPVLFFISKPAAQDPSIYKYMKMDTTKVIGQAELVQIAERFAKKFYTGMYDLQEKTMVDRQLKSLDTAKATRHDLATSLSSSGIMLAGLGVSQNSPIVFIAKAVSYFPKDTVIVNNFGAVLRLLDSVPVSLKVLLYAKSLDPSSPVILTNLANTLFEMNDDRSAEALYNRALRINPDFANARQGLVAVYLKRKDLKNAMITLFKGVKGAYAESLGKIHEQVKYSHSYPPPDESSFDKPGESGGNDINPNVPIDQLILPDFPNWADSKTLLNDGSIDRVSKKLSAIGTEAGQKEMDEYNKLSKMSSDQVTEWSEQENSPGRILAVKNKLGIELLEEYFSDQIDKIDKEHGTADSINIEKMGQQIDQMAAQDEAKAKQMQGDIDAWRQYFIRRCKELKGIRDVYFLQWRNLAAVRHRKYKDLMLTFWIYCEPYLNRTWDMNEFEKLNGERRSFVTIHFGYLYSDYAIRQMGFAFSNIASLATIGGDCPQEEPDKLPTANSDENAEVPDKEKNECPFEHSKAKIELGICSIGVDCESVEAECTEGLAGALKWNIKNKELTVFGGVGVRAPGKILGHIGTTAEIREGFELTFNTKGQVTDIALKGDITVEVGGVGQKIEMRVSAVTGVDVNRVNEFTYKAIAE